MSASPARARRAGASPAVHSALTAFRTAMLDVLRPMAGRPVIGDWKALNRYLHASLAFQRVEQFRVLFLNSRNELIVDEEIARGSIDVVHYHVREIAARALELGAAALVLAHNHPSGDPAASSVDRANTRRLIDVLKPLEIVVHDHIVIGNGGYTSLRAQGLLGY